MCQRKRFGGVRKSASVRDLREFHIVSQETVTTPLRATAMARNSSVRVMYHHSCINIGLSELLKSTHRTCSTDKTTKTPISSTHNPTHTPRCIIRIAKEKPHQPHMYQAFNETHTKKHAGFGNWSWKIAQSFDRSNRSITSNVLFRLFLPF